MPNTLLAEKAVASACATVNALGQARTLDRRPGRVQHRIGHVDTEDARFRILRAF